MIEPPRVAAGLVAVIRHPPTVATTRRPSAVPEVDRRTRFRTLAALAVAVLMTLAVLVPAAAGSTDRPFKGGLAGGGTVVPDASCPLGLRTVMWASGRVTHFGLTTMTGTHCTPPIGAASFSGVQTFVAANGQAGATYTATVEPFEPVEGRS
jgi:hypothetical protein